jgi:hypothetical protein
MAMPALTLVVCVHLQRDLLERLLRESRGCYDELVVLHDIPDTQNVRLMVEAAGGRFFERPRSFLQEPHWPFAWAQAKYDWILRLDADEFPSDEMKTWLKNFRRAPEPPTEISGFTCIWPLWNGRRAVTKHWPDGRIFLFHKQRVRFFGMCEQTPVPDGKYKPLDFVLHHQPPNRKIYGLWNMLIRQQSRRGRKFIARCLLGKPTDLICWRWDNESWPEHWEKIRRHPLSTAFRGLTVEPLRTLRQQWKLEGRLFLVTAIGGGLYRALTCLTYWRMKRRDPAGTGGGGSGSVEHSRKTD